MNLDKLLDISIEQADQNILQWEQFPENHINIAHRVLLLNRMIARELVSEYCVIDTELRQYERAKRKLAKVLNAQKIIFPPLEAQIKQLNQDLLQKRRHLANWGENLSHDLDLWQASGATLKDLCNLCNRRYEDIVAQIPKEDINMAFSGLIFAYNLDYNHKGIWLEYENDAPLTHAIKEYMLDIMLNTAKGKEAAHNALEACFPDIMEGAIHQSTDYDGNPVWRDKSGEIVAEFEE